jgi:flagellar motor protein MotB
MDASLDPRYQVRVWPAFTDILMSLALILVFYLFAQIVVESRTIAVLKEIDRRQELLREAAMAAIPAELRDDLRITADGNLQRYTFADRILFPSGEADLKASGKAVLEVLGRVFARHADELSQIQIEGHTDDVALRPGAAFASNWELSSARATSVVRFFEERCGLDPRLLSATGYSKHQPIDPADSEAARERNRRIEVVVVYSVAAIREQAGGGGRETSAATPPPAGGG